MSKKEFVSKMIHELDRMAEQMKDAVDIESKSYFRVKMSGYLDCAWLTGMISLEKYREYEAAYSIM